MFLGSLGALVCHMAMAPAYSAGVRGSGSHKDKAVNSDAAAGCLTLPRNRQAERLREVAYTPCGNQEAGRTARLP